MNVTAAVERNIKQVFSLLVFLLAVNRIRDAVILNLGDLNARAINPTATSGLTNLLMRPIVGFLLKP